MRLDLPDYIADELGVFVEVADELGCDVYLVGGPVRDVIIGRRVVDIDIVVPEDVWDFADLCEQRGARVKRNRHFFTAVVQFPGGKQVDVAQFRREEYPVPGSLPTALPGTWNEDALRRDFSVNALYMDLRDCEVYDFVGGLKDIERGVLRVLHPKSFSDDPTRLLRGLRLSHRLEFVWEKGTEELVKHALEGNFLACVSGPRVKREVRLIWEEEHWMEAFYELPCYLASFHPAFRSSFDIPLERIDEGLCILERKPSCLWVPLLLLLWRGKLETFDVVFHLTKREREYLWSFQKWKDGNFSPLDAPLDFLLFAYAVSGKGSFLEMLRRGVSSPLRIRGKDVVSMGVEGEEVGRILRGVRLALLEGKIDPPTRKAQLNYARELIKKV